MINLLKKTTSTVLAISIAITPFSTYSQNNSTGASFEDVARSAQGFGETLGQSAKQNFSDYSVSGKNVSVGSGNDININELFPSTSSGNTLPQSYFFPGGNAPSVAQLEGISNDSDQMDDVGKDWHKTLREEEGKADISLSGAAYEILRKHAFKPKDNFINDPMFNQSKDAFDNDMKDQLGECKTETSFETSTRLVHMPEYKTCDKVVDTGVSCTIRHDWDAGVIVHHSGPINLSACGEGCSTLWIGQVGDNYWGGWCSIYESATTVRVIRPEAVTNAWIDYAKWDDYIQILINGVKVYNGPNSNFPPETGGACELSTSWETNPNVNVTEHFRKVKPGDTLEFRIRVSVSGGGEGFGRLQIRYDPNLAITDNGWSTDNENCFKILNAQTDGISQVTVQCLDRPQVNTNGCAVTHGVITCPSHLDGAPHQSLDNLCKQYRVTSSRSFHTGAMDCYYDIHGVRQCPTNEGRNTDTCGALEADPTCGFISETCVGSAMGKSGTCYVSERKYDCGKSVEVEDKTKNTITTCTGPMKCMGADCLTYKTEDNKDFSKAAALLQASQFMAQDMVCTGLDGNGNPTMDQNVTCRVFKGKGGQCKIAVGGVQDCCESPGGTSLADYITLLMAVPKLDGAIMSLDSGNVVRSAYSVMKEPITSAWSEISAPLTSYAEGITGTVTEFFSPITELYTQFVSQLKGALQELLVETIQSTATEAISAEAANQMAQNSMNQISSFASSVMTVYTVYVVAVAVIQIIWACEKDELDLSMKKDLKSCTYLGSYCKSKVLGMCIEKRQSYCCYSSPLSRIMNEQAYPQLGKNFGTVENPVCEGLSPDEIGRLDWDRINLDEWMGILAQTNNLDTVNNISMDRLTGSGSALHSSQAPRMNTLDRTMERLEGIDLDEIKKNAEYSVKPY